MDPIDVFAPDFRFCLGKVENQHLLPSSEVQTLNTNVLSSFEKQNYWVVFALGRALGWNS